MKYLATILFAAVLAPITQAASLAVSQPGITSGDFSWSGGVGASTDFRAGTSGAFAYDDLSLVGPTGFIFHAQDDYVVGDAFAPVIDGVQTTWTTTWTTTDGYFAGLDIGGLSGGLHTMDLIVTEDCCGGGAGHWKMIAGPVGEVPLPAGVWLFLSALAGLGVIKRKNA